MQIGGSIATLIASAAGFVVANPIAGSDTDLAMPELHDPHMPNAGWILLVGIVTGMLGVAYNKAIMASPRFADRSRLPAEARGLFAPMLVLGADSGPIVGLIAAGLFPASAPDPAALALIGMASFFAVSVHAPVTGLVLATELTGTTSQLPPMLGACATALLVVVMVRFRGIYDMLAARATAKSTDNSMSVARPS
ncbi:chloride channel protein [Gordonia sp. (in: high G+C Gram-positive bacteria)]|uniref:chloride channel protein n=1 Tax=Gordonia sp. (in: high G+C Gram-positive bacteria) TaxID=84139 RepID=UPI003F94D09C